MKKIIFLAWIVAIPLACFSQQKAKTPKVTKNKANIIQSVEFPDSIPASKITPSASVFFKDFLKTTGNDNYGKNTYRVWKEFVIQPIIMFKQTAIRNLISA